MVSETERALERESRFEVPLLKINRSLYTSWAYIYSHSIDEDNTTKMMFTYSAAIETLLFFIPGFLVFFVLTFPKNERKIVFLFSGIISCCI